MKTSIIPDITPEHEEGKHNDLEEHVAMESVDDADELFVIAKERLLHVNDWHTYAGALSGVFTLTDSRGKELHRRAHKGDYIKILLPGPGENAGNGYDWVHIEALEYDDYPDTDSEVLAMTVRPVTSPETRDQNTAHFFDNKATSTFSVQRHGAKVSATYHGRNETPNTGTDNLVDKVRNAAMALGAMLGFSELQWTGLLKGFLKFDETEA